VPHEQIQNQRQHKILSLNQIPAHFGEAAKKQFDDLTYVQAELFQQAQEANKQWLNRVQTEANLSAEFVSNLSAARSIPEVVTVFQHWGARRLEIMVDDSKHLMGNAQKLMQTGGSLFANESAKTAAPSLDH
jgi:Phasin protein